ncbi:MULTISPECIES: hypothetical protein [Haloferax]|jgi:hypothetical protein|uniref:Preprotein translocase subunit TatA n=6 Tax=Haloferax TaxID=2251 RepID=A0A384KND9_HALVD|nr:MULTISPECIES: hypothetical protein [Haloferax]ADE02859.1 uncharacterized protein HVO_2459 [Haloferax volcanii DS2]ELK55909.1 hypothetical protein D320_02028 [Haloferax sp. BAB-2207]ELY32899.1 hypothetical protein C498_07585 [Haloferax volcanii DS2]ELZ76126.1 hypothetical protein C456_04850 [Haloferax lucentense DSM 14919]ELZ86810.1 hypothetical protein C452_16170 [Haloferax alexandrinus JCM 10717]
MALLQIPGGPELVILALLLLIPLALVYLGYKLVQSLRAFEEGREEQSQR